MKAKWRLRIKQKWWITYDVHWLMWYTLWLSNFTHRLLYSICFTREREREWNESVPYILYVVQFLLWKYVFECYRNTYQKCYCCLNTKTVVKTMVPNNPSVWQNFSNFEMHANLMGCIPKNKRVHAFIFVGFFFKYSVFAKNIYIYIN